MLDLALPLIAFLFADGLRRRGGATAPGAPPAHVHTQPTVHQAKPKPKPKPKPPSGPAPSAPPGPPPIAATAPAPHVAPPAWPAAVPSDLPPFPGPGWIPHPSPGRVASRASALLPQLWAKGEGTHVIEQTNGEWVAYKAAYMGSKKGVVAYVPRPVCAQPASSNPRPPIAAPAPPKPRPQAAPAPAPAPKPRPPAVLPPADVVLPEDVITVSTHEPPAAAENRPTLSVGSTGAYVVDVQKRLGVTAKGGGYTGYYGTMTADAVRKFQRSRGLPDDGVVGPSTWAALDGVAA